MDYKVIELKEKIVVGLSARTKNSDENMTNIISSLWNDFYQKGIYSSILNKKNEKAMGIYSDYEDKDSGEYNVTVGSEVSSAETIPADTIIKTIPAGKYAKFVVRGAIYKVVADFWEDLWKIDSEKFERNYRCDFEEYQSSDMEDAEVHIYISIN
ncbi:GyrI-like domain-containing protein [Anaerosacchariphilus polymeriproducens]|uniref:AraC family transcriptional regulator n=1 Tax=Anaerosacchariphilus polymeriproducens TaxID=1812858 RepID=A0A371AR18_9FIRM|nr:GyrI-like domain-containing protein [Anaerosacchariphilus polymeriproducens]RDU22027.1 AraC family transcriptional regulator [Anaerosacchariphilus polymeriproducens]